jgi:hypothetical protein
MALIDERGRLFGRVNIIDAVVAGLLIGMIPLAYAAFLLFRQPEPTILSVSPAQLTPQVSRVRITGRNLRPFLRVSFNNQQGTTFALLDAQTAEVQVPQLAPGTYDVILYDVAREVSRLSNAVTVEGPTLSPMTEARILLTGTFLGLDDAAAAMIASGVSLGAVGGGKLQVVKRNEALPDRRPIVFSGYEIDTPLANGKQVSALLDATCGVVDRRCQIGGVDIEVGNALAVFTDAGTPLQFVITDAAGTGPSRLVLLRATFVVPANSPALVRAGDHVNRDALLGDRVATITDVGASRRANASMMLRVPTGFSGGGDLEITTTDDTVLIDATVRVRADVGVEGLEYRGRKLRVGSPYMFETSRYVLRGWLSAIEEISGAAERE